MGRESEKFVDHYALLKCSPDISTAELRKAYHGKLREFHPDKRSASSTDLGHRVTQDLNQAWAVLHDPDSRERYDEIWRAEQSASLSLGDRAELHRKKGNDLFRAARAMYFEQDTDLFRAASVHKYQAAIEQYCAGIALMPSSHLLWSNRATCYAVLGNWARCQEDALRVTELKPAFAKGWILLVQTFSKQGSLDVARKQMEVALRHVPGNEELLRLQSELASATACTPEDLPEPVISVTIVEGSSFEAMTEPAPSQKRRERPLSGSRRRAAAAFEFAASMFASKSEASPEPVIYVTPVDGCSLETTAETAQDRRGRSRKPSWILSSLLASTLGCTSTPLVSPTGTPASTPISSRSSTPMPPPLVPKLRPTSNQPGVSSQSTPANSRASTPTKPPSTAPKMSTLGSNSRPTEHQTGDSCQTTPDRSRASMPTNHIRSAPKMSRLGPKSRPTEHRPGVSCQTTPDHSRASTPTNRPSSAPRMPIWAVDLGGSGRRASSRSKKIAPSPPLAASHATRTRGPGPTLEGRDPMEPNSGCDSDRRRGASLSSLAASSRLRVPSRPTSAGSSRSRSASMARADVAWS